MSGFSKDEINILLPVTRKILIQEPSKLEPEGGTEWYGAYPSDSGSTAAELVTNFDSARYITSQDKVFLLNIKELAQDIEGKGSQLIKSSAALNQSDENISNQEGSEYWIETSAPASPMMVDITGKISSFWSFLTVNSVEGVCPAVVLDNSNFSVIDGHGSRISPYILGGKNAVPITKNIDLKVVTPDSWAMELERSI